ncbi:MAG: hypothetical protein AB7E85_00730 [Pseudobdellovibrionaceae bacterium]
MLLRPQDDAAAEAMGRDPKTGRLILAFCTAAGALGAALTKATGLVDGLDPLVQVGALYGSFAVGQAASFIGAAAYASKSPYITEWVDPYPYEDADAAFNWEQATGTSYAFSPAYLGK